MVAAIDIVHLDIVFSLFERTLQDDFCDSVFARMVRDRIRNMIGELKDLEKSKVSFIKSWRNQSILRIGRNN